MKSKLIIIIIACCLVSNIAGQDFNIPSSLDLDFFKRGISPQVALINRYGDYPVDLQTGLVDISIPLYTMQSTYLTIPLQLKFHASGLRADEREGLLGLRWALGGGGHVSRIIKGYPDDFYPFNNQVSNPNYVPDFYTLFGTTGSKKERGHDVPGNNSEFTSAWWYDVEGNQHPGGNYQDTEYDIFSYSLPSGKSGKFILKDDNGTKTACSMPYEPIRIQVNQDTGTGRFSSITIIDENGITYQFGVFDDRNEDGWVTTWHLYSVTSANKKDVIVFNYERGTNRASTWDRSLMISSYLHDYSDFYKAWDPHYYYEYRSPMYLLLGDLLLNPQRYFKKNNKQILMSLYAPYFITSVQLKSNDQLISHVDFNYERNQYGQLMQYMKDITVKDGQNNLMKKIGFILKNNQSGKIKLLDKIEFISTTDSSKKEVYSFDYYDSSTLPACSDLSNNSDWWGYYSEGGGWLLAVKNYGIMANTGGNNNVIVYQDIVGGDKRSRLESMRLGMIREICYPTGGTTEFEYGVNKYGTKYTCGGMRIEKIINKPSSGKPEIKRYEYANGSIPSYLEEQTRNIFIENEIDCFAVFTLPINQYLADIGYGSYLQQTFQNTFPSYYTDFHSNIVYYQKVTEYFENKSEKNIGKTVYEYNILIPSFSWYNSLEGENPFTGYNGYQHGHVSPKNFWKGNNLRSKTIYDNRYKKVKEYIYSYGTFEKESIFDLSVFRYRQYLISLNSVNYNQRTDLEELRLMYANCSDCAERSFAIKHQEYTIGAEKLVKETENTYYPNGTKTSVEKEISYDPVYLLPIEEKITNSDGTVIKKNFKYPHQIGRTPYSTMVSKNILTPIIELTNYAGSELLRRKTTLYREWVKNCFAPEDIILESKDLEYSGSHIVYNNYNSYGNPVDVSRNYEDRIVCLWGYNNQYPVAEIKYASYWQVEAVLGMTFIDQLANKSVLSTTDFSALNNLRTLLPQAHVTTYVYKPLIGLTSSTDPRGITTHYEYDSLDRLKTIYIMNGNNKEILENYEYKYANQ